MGIGIHMGITCLLSPHGRSTNLLPALKDFAMEALVWLDPYMLVISLLTSMEWYLTLFLSLDHVGCLQGEMERMLVL